MSIIYKAPARLDAWQVKQSRQEFEKLAFAQGDVVVDMARTEVLDGSGVGAMVFAFKRLAATDGSLTWCQDRARAGTTSTTASASGNIASGATPCPSTVCLSSDNAKLKSVPTVGRTNGRATVRVVIGAL